MSPINLLIALGGMTMVATTQLEAQDPTRAALSKNFVEPVKVTVNGR